MYSLSFDSDWQTAWARKAATWLVKAGELVTAATIKGGYSAADTVRDTLVYKPGEPIDWAKFGTTWLKSGLTTLLSDGIAEGLKVGLASIYNFKGAAALPDLHKLASEVAGNLTASLLSTVAGLVTDAAASGNKDTSGKLLTRALDKNPDKTQELFLKINKKIIDDIQGGAVSVAADHLTEALLKKDGAQKLLNLIKTVLAKK